MDVPRGCAQARGSWGYMDLPQQVAAGAVQRLIIPKDVQIVNKFADFSLISNLTANLPEKFSTPL